MTMALVLNVSHQPLGVVSDRRAAMLVLMQKADALDHSRRVLRSARLTLTTPHVVRLRYYVPMPPDSAASRVTRSAVFARDAHKCAYCGRRPDTLDHVVPRSRGGLHVWGNVVAACEPCNNRKGDRLLSELGWSLPEQPRAPRNRFVLLCSSGGAHHSWLPYLGVESQNDGLDPWAAQPA